MVEPYVFRDPFPTESIREVRRMKARIERERIPELVSAVVASGARVYAVEPRHESLEERFLSLLGQ